MTAGRRSSTPVVGILAVVLALLLPAASADGRTREDDGQPQRPDVFVEINGLTDGSDPVEAAIRQQGLTDGGDPVVSRLTVTVGAPGRHPTGGAASPPICDSRSPARGVARALWLQALRVVPDVALRWLVRGAVPVPSAVECHPRDGGRDAGD